MLKLLRIYLKRIGTLTLFCKMAENVKHWKSCVKFIWEDKFPLLEDLINEFCKGKFVVGIQYFQDVKTHVWNCVVSYKVLEE